MDADLRTRRPGSRASLLRSLRARLRPLAALARRLARHLRGVPQVGQVHFGDLRRLSPLCPDYGYSRGLPIDRVYIEDFLALHAADVRGRVLEVQEDNYTRRFGGDAVTRADVIDINAGNPRATVIADLRDAGALPKDSYDAVILTQTLQLIYEFDAAIATVHRALKPGGALLCTVAGVSAVGRSGGENRQWCWCFTELSLQRALAERFGAGQVRTRSYGNVLTATAFLQGLAASELTADEYAHHDASYPVVVAARAVKRADPA